MHTNTLEKLKLINKKVCFNFKNTIPFKNQVKANRFYSKNYLLPISANEEITFEFNNIELGIGLATLSMSLGRDHDLSKTPTVLVNGEKVEVPLNWKGYDQANRKKFFGAIKIPVPMNLIKENNKVDISFPDSGGHLSSLILNLEKIVNRSN